MKCILCKGEASYAIPRTWFRDMGAIIVSWAFVCKKHISKVKNGEETRFCTEYESLVRGE